MQMMKKKTEEINYYNKTTLDYIKILIKMEKQKNKNLLELLINHIKSISSFVLQKEITPEIEEKTTDLIKCKEKEEITPKDIKADELDNMIFIGKEFQPLYRYYKRGTFFIIEIQLCSQSYEFEKGFPKHGKDVNSQETKFTIKGERKLNINIAEEKNYFTNKRQNFKKFEIVFILNLQTFGIKHITKEPSYIKMKYGLLFLIYNIL